MTEAEATLAPKAELKEIGPCKYLIKIEVGADAVKERIEHKMNDVADDVAVPGFRRGHVPRRLVERKFGSSIAEDVKVGLISESYHEVVEQHKLQPLGDPQIDPEKIQFAEGKPLAYEVVLEVRPQFELKTYTGIAAQRPKIEVSEKDLEATLQGMREAHAELTPVEAGAAAKGDFVTADTEVLVGGAVIDRADNSTFALEDTLSLFKKPAPEVLKALVGSKVGQALQIAITLPGDYPRKEAAGQKATLKLAVKGVRRKKLPELSDAWAKTMDFDNLEELKAEVRKRIGTEKEKEADRFIEEQILDVLVRQTDFPLPEGLIQGGTEEVLQRQKVELHMRGMKPEEIEKQIAQIRGASREEIVNQLKAHFILESIGQREKIFVTEAEVEDRIAGIAPSYGKWPHEMKAYLEENDMTGSLRRQLRAEKIRAFLRSKANVKPG